MKDNKVYNGTDELGKHLHPPHTYRETHIHTHTGSHLDSNSFSVVVIS